MEELRERVWEGTINVEVVVSDAIVVPNTTLADKSCHIVMLRDAYLGFYLPTVVRKLADTIKVPYESDYRNWWFEYNGEGVPWEYPCGVLFDLLNKKRKKQGNELDDTSLQMWELQLCHGDKYPRGILPLVDGHSQIKDYWRHQWKQACFILNGSAKRIMSLSIPDFENFWVSILSRNRSDFMAVRSKLFSMNKSKSLPVRVWTSNHAVLQPTVPVTDKELSVAELLDAIKLSSDGVKSVTIQGIDVSIEDNIFELYDIFASIDGFLYLVTK